MEELDSDDDNSPQGVELHQAYGQPRHRSNELHFTGIDLGAGMVRRRRSVVTPVTVRRSFLTIGFRWRLDRPSGLS